MNRRYQSSITVFLCLMFLIFVLVITAVIDFTRLFTARAQIVRAVNSAALSALAGYSERLKSQYGLLYIDKSAGELKDSIRDLTLTNLNPPDDVDGFHLFKYVIDPDALEINRNNPLTLSDPDLLKTQVLEYTKYLAPLDIGLENYYGRLISGENSDQFQELTEGFKKSFNIVDFIDRQTLLDMEINRLFKKCLDVYESAYGGIYTNEDALYINRIKEPGWVFPDTVSASSLQTALPADPAELALYAERLRDTSDMIDRCELLISEITQPLITDLRDNELAAFEEYLDYADSNALFYESVVQEARDKLGFYNTMLNTIEADLADYQDLSDLLGRNRPRIDDLYNIMNDIINGDAGTAEEYDDIINNQYEEAPYSYPDMIFSVNPNNLYGDYITEFDAVSLNALLVMNRDTGYEKLKTLVSENIMSDFFTDELTQNALGPGLTVSGLPDDSIFAGLTGAWTGNINNPPFTDSTGDIIAALNSLSVTDPADPSYNKYIIDRSSMDERVWVFAEVFNIAGFANTIMALTKDSIDSADPSSDLPLDQFLINYYAMKTFKSFTTEFVSMDPSNEKRNLEGEPLRGLTDHRDLTYELEYLLTGAPDENASAKYAGLTLYGARMAECLSYVHTNADAKKVVYYVTKLICEEVPRLQPYFTEVKEAAAMFLAASEAAVEFKALKAGGTALILKASGEAPADEFFYLNKFTNDIPDDGLTAAMEDAVNIARNKILGQAKPAEARLTAAPTPAVRHTPTPAHMAPPEATVTPLPTPAAVPITERLKTSEFNYDAHLMTLLSTAPNSVKIQRIQDIISFNESEGAIG
ncbi:MAG: Tad domain-containing protein, partial [Clostridiales bacterium]|nr:Tad domain-containing protein [Clostridiales bacterium]